MNRPAATVRDVDDARDAARVLSPTPPTSRLRSALRWSVVALLPLVALVEMVVGRWQERRVPTQAEWARAGVLATELARPDASTRLPIVVAPRWATPLGDMSLGGLGAVRPIDQAIVDTHVTGRSSLETAARVVEISVYGHDDPEIARWHVARSDRFGALTVRVLDNPAPARLLRDLSDEIDPTASVSRVDPAGNAKKCDWQAAGAQKAFALFAGPMAPLQRFSCPPNDPNWTFVAPTVITDLDYVPRRCIFMHPDRDQITRVELPPRPIGRRIVAWTGLPYLAERELKLAPYHAAIAVDGHRVAEVTHVDGDGWKRFEGDTSQYAGKTGAITIDTWVDGGASVMRQACVAAEVRE
jgi:hypothetical protein